MSNSVANRALFMVSSVSYLLSETMKQEWKK